MPYLTLNELPEGRLCRPLFVPDDPEWLALFGGALTELTKVWNYQQFGTLTPEEMAVACELIIQEWYDATCGSCTLPTGEPILRLGEGGTVEELSGDEWITPTGDYYIPPPSARTGGTADERRCLAAANAVNVLHDVYEEITDLYGTGLGTLEIIAGVGIFIAGAIAVAVGAVAVALMAFAVAVWELAFETTEFVTADFWTSSFTDNFRCILYHCATDDAGVVTFDFDCVNEKLLNATNWFDPTLGSSALAAQVRYLLYAIGKEGLDLAGRTTALTSASCTNCNTCPPQEWCFFHDDVEIDPSSGRGTWVYGAGWRSTYLPTRTAAAIRYRCTVNSNIDSIAFKVSFTAQGSLFWSIRRVSDGVTVNSGSSNPVNIGAFQVLAYQDFRATALPFGEYYIYVDCGRNDNSGQFTIHGFGMWLNPGGTNPMHANGTCSPK